MSGIDFTELKRRTIVKSLVWRVIGVIWTWIGAFLIIVSVPPSWKTAPVIAMLIVIYHHLLTLRINGHESLRITNPQ